MPQIPEAFHSLETDTPFKTCCDCGCELLDSAEMYMVQKSFAKAECVMEFALCDQCKKELDAQISDESKEALYDFLFDNSDVLKAEHEPDPSEVMQQIEQCLVCERKRSDCESYTYSGLFVGSHIVAGLLPMMICDHCQEAISENMSDHTRDVKDKFYRENFPGPPSEIDLPNSKPIFL